MVHPMLASESWPGVACSSTGSFPSFVQTAHGTSVAILSFLSLVTINTTPPSPTHIHTRTHTHMHRAGFYFPLGSKGCILFYSHYKYRQYPVGKKRIYNLVRSRAPPLMASRSTLLGWVPPVSFQKEDSFSIRRLVVRRKFFFTSSYIVKWIF